LIRSRRNGSPQLSPSQAPLTDFVQSCTEPINFSFDLISFGKSQVSDRSDDPITGGVYGESEEGPKAFTNNNGQNPDFGQFFRRPSLILLQPRNTEGQPPEKTGPLSSTEIFCTTICNLAGVRFVGIQKGFDIRPDFCLFSSPLGSTLSVPVNEMCVSRILEAIRKSNTSFGEK